jgi:hypothetical protein
MREEKVWLNCYKQQNLIKKYWFKISNIAQNTWEAIMWYIQRQENCEQILSIDEFNDLNLMLLQIEIAFQRRLIQINQSIHR